MAFHLDYETTSVCPITYGTYRYAADPSTRILMFAIAEDDGEPLLWDFLDPYCDESLAAEELARRASEPADPIYAHNSQFELAISHYRLKTDVGIAPPHLDQWRCTLAMCRRAAAPESLEKAAIFFGLDNPKNPAGKTLIRVFSDQTAKVKLTLPDGSKRDSFSPVLESPIPWDARLTVAGEQITVRQAWEDFKEYCRQDVRVEQELHRRIKHFELRGPVLDSFQFDLRMNFRGVPVNVPALQFADGLVNRLQAKLGKRFEDITGVAPSRRDAVLQWLLKRGYPEDNLRAGTVEAVLADPPPTMAPEAVRALRLRSQVSFAALKKIPAMLNSVCPDGRVRGTTQWHSARTGRPGGRIIQPQNFKKSTIGEEAHLCYRMIQEEWQDVWFEELWESPLEAVASSIRHFIQPHEGRLLDLDYDAVEAKITPWLAGDTAKLQSILDGVDPYKRIASMVFDTPYDAVTKDQRTVAKPIELGCCFGVGGKGLRTSLATMFKVERSLKECREYVKIYRDNHPETVGAWRSIEDAAKFAIRNPGKSQDACDGKLSFKCGKVSGVPYLTMRLPSGRRLYYPYPEIKDEFKKYDEDEMQEEPWKAAEKGYWVESIRFYGKQMTGVHWGRVPTWGSRLFENAVQATGADLLNRGCVEAERRGFPICMIVHDQALCEEVLASGSLEEFTEALCTKDDWAADFPLTAAGETTDYYLKG